MSDTLRYTVTKGEWTNVSLSASNGFVTNEGPKAIQYIEDDVTPTVSKGHTLLVGDYINFELVAGQEIWCKSVAEDTEVAVTTS